MADLDRLIAQGQSLLVAGDFRQALQQFEQVLRLEPGNAAVQFLRGECLYQLGDFVGTVRALSSLPTGDDPVLALEHAMTLGRAHQQLGHAQTAELLLMQAYVMAPSSAAAAHNLAAFYEEQGRLQEALTFLEAGVRDHPQNTILLYNLGAVLSMGADSERATHMLERVLALQPHHAKAHQNLALLHLRRGHFSAGWAHYAWRFNRHQYEGYAPDWVPFTPSWPASLKGQRILVRGEQGIGDELFFMRFLPELRRRGAQITYQVRNPKLLSLWDCAKHGADDLDAWQPPDADDRCVAPPWEQEILAGDLPLALALGDALPCPPSVVLQPPHSMVQAMHARFPVLGRTRPRVGVAWRAGTQVVARQTSGSERWLSKSVPLDLLLSVLEPLNLELVVLQRGLQDAERSVLDAHVPGRWTDASMVDENLTETLALLSCLDTLVGVSNTNVHLFAALGQTCHTLVPVPAEFRWLESGDNSPWFPGCGVYRQSSDGRWDAALAQLRQTLSRTFR